MSTRDPALGAALAIEGMERAVAGSGEWKHFAIIAIERVARRQRYLTADDVWEELDRMGVARPREPRAMGIMKSKAAGQFIKLCGMSKTEMPSGHGHPFGRWESLVFGG